MTPSPSFDWILQPDAARCGWYGIGWHSYSLTLSIRPTVCGLYPTEGPSSLRISTGIFAIDSKRFC